MDLSDFHWTPLKPSNLWLTVHNRELHCRYFQDTHGLVEIPLGHHGLVRTISIDHPFDDQRVPWTSAPRQIRIWTIHDESDNGMSGIFLPTKRLINTSSTGRHPTLSLALLSGISYDAQSSLSQQNFSITGQASKLHVKKIMVEIVNNWGNSYVTYLCGLHLFGH